MSKGELILTGLALIAGSLFMIRCVFPLWLEWLECMSIDETMIGKEDEYGQADNR